MPLTEAEQAQYNTMQDALVRAQVITEELKEYIKILESKLKRISDIIEETE